MKTTLLAVVAAFALTSFTSSAFAAPQDAKTESVQIKASNGYKMMPDDFVEYAHTYQLSNDAKVRFSQRVAHYYVEVSGGKKTEMFAVAPGVFETTSGVRVEFQDDGFNVAIENYERLPMAQALPANTRVMASR